ncbi:hypothetical protein [Leucobacter sp. 7(1)]|uniref:hypothetical protein n=1 Tax=Leucobacter sp. 7(1) TaxID=1255613 RepID=UPI001121089C|nr:hypothetical protein [Leucobacter sp. 7(1)]
MPTLYPSAHRTYTDPAPAHASLPSSAFTEPQEIHEETDAIPEKSPANSRISEAYSKPGGGEESGRAATLPA